MKVRGGYGSVYGYGNGYGSSRTSVEEEPELEPKEEGRGGWLRQRMAAMAEREYGAYFRAAQWLSPLMDEVLIMICFGKREQWIETTRCLEASQVTVYHFGHASQPPRAL